jgi:hypothetical protein
MMHVNVSVQPPSACGNDSIHTYCTIVAPADVENVCKFKLGSPLICDGSNIAGFVISDGGCETRGSQTIMRYNSVAAYEEWMELGFTTSTTAVPTTTMSTRTTTQGAGQMEFTKLGLLFVIFAMFLNF